MRSRSVRFGVGALAGAALALTSILSVSAHEHRMIGGGKFAVLVGWQDEPTFTGVRNAVQFFLDDPEGHAINDLGDTLKLTVIYKDHTSGPVSLEPSFDPDTGFGTMGLYDAAIIPTHAGTYTMHFTGTIHGVPIDERFTSSDTTFANVEESTSIEFPGDLGKMSKKGSTSGDMGGMPAPKGAAVGGVLSLPLLGLLGARLLRNRRRSAS